MQTILVQNRGTNLFLIGDYDWTCDEEAARRFHTVQGALTHCTRHEIRNAAVVKRDASGAHEVVIPVPRGQQELSAVA